MEEGPTRRARKPRQLPVRSSDCPIFVALFLVLPFLYLSLSLPTTFDLDTSTASIDYRLEKSVPSVSCQLITQNVNATNEYHSKQYWRYTSEAPHFWISLHSQNYDPVRWSIMDHGKYYEQAQTRSFVEILNASSTKRVIDVGGNIGWYSLLSAAMGARVDVFEPNYWNFVRLCESLCRNGWDQELCGGSGNGNVPFHKAGQVTIFPRGVGETASNATFSFGIGGRNPGSGNIVDTSHRNPHNKILGDVQTVQLVPLDQMAYERGWYGEVVDILKVDVEGFEVHVFRGATKLIKSQRIQNIFLEGDVETKSSRHDFEDVSNLLLGAGYEVFKIGGYQGPTNGNVPPKGDTFLKELTQQCAGGLSTKNKQRKKCNLWWRLQIKQ